MKICQINCVYGEGSTGKITRDIHLYLQKKGINSIVLVPMTSHLDKGVFQFSNKTLSYCSAAYRRGFGRQFDGAQLQTSRILNILKKEKPDIVHLQCINGNNINIYRLLNYLSDNRIKTVLTLHAEYPYTGGCGHAYDCEKWLTGCEHCPILREGTQSVLFDGTHHTWTMQKRCYDRFSPDDLIVTAVSPWLKIRAEMSPMLAKFEKKVILNGCDTNVFKPRENNYWHEKLKMTSEKRIIAHVTASFSPEKDDLKGGRYIYQLAERFKESPFVFVVASNYGEVSNLPDNLIYVGRTETQARLAELYSEAECTVITSKRETFSMVLAESLCCGTPVVGFEAGGPESIAVPGCTRFVKYGNVDALETALVNMIGTMKQSKEISALAHRTYSRDSMVNNYTELYKSLLIEREEK